jgi:hypothetical protein
MKMADRRAMTRDDLVAAIAWAETVGQTDAEIAPGEVRRYGTATVFDTGATCTLHGAAVLLATGRPDNSLRPDDYGDLGDLRECGSAGDQPQ